MHGVRRQRPGQRDPEDIARAKAAKESARVQEYTGLRAQLAECKLSADYTRRALDLTTQILLKNPEYPSGWSYRRRILLRGLLPDAREQDQQKILDSDLDVTTQCFKRNPKEYAVWNHRKWILKTMPDPDWRFELKTVEGLLERDARNYHAWDYRRYLVASIQAANTIPLPEYSTRKRPAPSTSSELAFTTAKISASFSNFSAWHYRSKMLARLWQETAQNPESDERKRKVDEEFELVKQALYTDPDDQSAWIYHRWLVGQGKEDVLRREIGVIEELTELEPESKWCLESLVHYNRLLLQHVVGDGSETESIRAQCRTRLQTLQRADPLRRHRYQEMLRTI